MSEKKHWIVVSVFALAMAWMEAATVVYLRTLTSRIQPYQATPLPVSVGLGQIEIVREAATMVMLLTVGLLAGRTWRSRLAYGMIAFGVWDIFYYVFLAIMTGWPRSIMDWDVLFLIPLPWWGPVLSPVLIALLLVHRWNAGQSVRSTRSTDLAWLEGVVAQSRRRYAGPIRLHGRCAARRATGYDCDTGSAARSL